MISFENLDNEEKERFQDSITLILKLFSNNRKEEIIDTFFNVINLIRTKEPDNGKELGAIQEEDDGHYTVEYVKYNKRNQIESLHQSIHELIHILGVPNEKLTAGKDANGGLQIAELNNETRKWEYYGYLINESCDELLTKMALSQKDDVDYTADEVILSNEVSHSSGYKEGIPIARLLAFAMNNEFYREYSDLMKNGIGIVDAKTNLDMPINDLFYGMAIDPLYTESRFDEYSKDGEYKRINKNLDFAFENGSMMSVDLLKETMISISNMFNNKMYQYLTNEMISEDVYNQCCEQYELLFSRICEYYRDMYNIELTFNPDENMRMYESMRIYKNNSAIEEQIASKEQSGETLVQSYQNMQITEGDVTKAYQILQRRMQEQEQMQDNQYRNT